MTEQRYPKITRNRLLLAGAVIGGVVVVAVAAFLALPSEDVVEIIKILKGA